MDSLEYKQTPFDELEWWFATFKQERTLGSPEETRAVQSALRKQVIVFDPQNAATSFKKLTRDPTFGALLSLAYHTVILRPRSRSRTQRQPGGLTQDKFFRYVAATLPHMRNVREFILLDPSVDPSAAAAQDLFESKSKSKAMDMQLETLWCASEALLARCWASLCNGRALIKLQDFRGFCDPHQPPPSRIVPLGTPELKYLETSAHFALRLQAPWCITHLCIHVEWSELPLILRKISTLPGLSIQLHAFRLNCYTRAGQHPAGSGAATPRRKFSPFTVHWPRIIFRNLDARVLNYLEIKEVTPYDGASAPVFPSGPRMNGGNGTPSLRRIAWRPAWNEAISRQSGKEIKGAVDAIFSRALTVDFLAIALDRNDAGSWRVFTRDIRSGRVEDAERTQAINELSWKVTEWTDARGKRWHWPQSSRLYAQESLIS